MKPQTKNLVGYIFQLVNASICAHSGFTSSKVVGEMIGWIMCLFVGNSLIHIIEYLFFRQKKWSKKQLELFGLAWKVIVLAVYIIAIYKGLSADANTGLKFMVGVMIFISAINFYDILFLLFLGEIIEKRRAKKKEYEWYQYFLRQLGKPIHNSYVGLTRVGHKQLYSPDWRPMIELDRKVVEAEWDQSQSYEQVKVAHRNPDLCRKKDFWRVMEWDEICVN